MTAVALAALMVGLFAWLRADLAALRKEMRAEIGELREDMDGKITGLRGEIGGLREDMDGKFSRLRGEISLLSKEVAELRERMARMEGLLDGLREAVTGKQAA